MDSYAPSTRAGPPNCPIPRILIAATHSGAGKTSFTLGLLSVFRKRGLDVQAFKAGPDYIDPALHTALTQRPSRNLDTRLMSQRCVVELFLRNARGADLALVEGVMGYYDGVETGQRSGSTASLARILRLPVLLLIDVRGMSSSAAATALGFLRYGKTPRIKGFLLNKVGSQRHYGMTRRAIEEATGLPVLGYLPKDDSLSLAERHLGLVDPHGSDSFWSTVDRLQEATERFVDIDGLLTIARSAPELKAVSSLLFPPEEAHRQKQEAAVRIAVARDEAFSFYYEDNLDLLRRFGAELVFFSPLKDRQLPSGIGGLYLGGGYPELHVQEINANADMRQAIRDAAEKGIPILAECGGFMYLLEEIEGTGGMRAPGAGVFRGRSVMGKRRAALGYYDAEVLEDCIIARKGSHLVGHAFHWSSIESPEQSANPALLLSRDGAAPVADGMIRGEIFASYVHFHFATHPGAARRFVAHCRRFVSHCRRFALKPEVVHG